MDGSKDLKERPKSIDFSNMDCLYRLIGQCRNCSRDYDPRHHPNNLDCPRHHLVGIFYVRESK